MSPESPKSPETQTELFTDEGTPTSEAVGDVNLVDSPLDVLRSEYQGLFKYPPDQSWDRNQLLSAIYSPIGQPAKESAPVLQYETLSDRELESHFKEKLAQEGENAYSPNGLTREEIIGYLQELINTNSVLLRLREIAAREEKDDLNDTYKR